MLDQHDISQQSEDEVAEGEASEMSRLFAAVFSEQTEGMDADEAAAYLAEIMDEGDLESELFERLGSTDRQPFLVTNYHPDTAVREASLASEDKWKRAGGEMAYLASNSLEVYLGNQGRPLEIGEALDTIRKLNESTVLTARIALGIWNNRRATKLTRNGSVPVLLEELLLWQGHEKRSRLAHPHTEATKRHSDGFRTEQRKRVVQDMALLSTYYVRGSCSITVRGKNTIIEVNGPYLHHSLVFRRTRTGEKILIGFMVSPGDWISTYEEHQVESLAQIDRQIFRLNPQNDKYALRLALYLTERWREQTQTGAFSSPIAMHELLANSMIEVDRPHLTTTFAPKIEAALARLEEMGIVGKQICLTPVDKEKARWGKDWLAARWEILPPVELIRLPVRARKRRVPDGQKLQPRQGSAKTEGDLL